MSELIAANSSELPAPEINELVNEPVNGLSASEVRDRQQRGDVNVVVLRSSRTYKEIFQENVFTLFNVTFGIILVLLIALGQVTDAIFSGFSVFMNILVGVAQEMQAKLTLDKLALLSVQQVRVRRDGETLAIAVGEVVRDDLIELNPGDRAPVDGAVVMSQNVEMDESLLTGESDPVAKQIGDIVLSGSFCLSGSCVFRADKIGNESYAVKLSQSSRVYKRVFTPLQKKIDVLVEIFILVLIVAAFLHIASSLNSGRTMVDTIRYASVIINSFVPAGLVLSISVAFAIGAVEISKRRTLIQKINAVDSMNSVRILCTDKTGTLTQNKLTVKEIIPFGDTDGDSLRELIALYANLMATQNSSAKAMAAYTDKPRSPALAIGEVPFSSSRKWGAIAIDLDVTIMVGAPEILLTDDDLLEQSKQYARQGLRAIAIVTSDGSIELGKNPALPTQRRARGLVLLEDSLRPDAIATIASLQNQNIRIKVISGDSVETVTSIARQAGIAVPDDAVFTQATLEAMDQKTFSQAAASGSVFGRIVPEMKRRLISAMVKRGGYVGMVGDGVNDVPAFKEAQLAIAMNDGAQISKDVADIVLLDNNLAALPQAFAAGDAIKQKILSSALIYLTKNIMVILTISFAGFVQLPFPIEPRQMTILTMAVVALPTVWIAFGWLKTKRIENFLRDVLGYSCLAGLFGAIAMTIGYIFSYYLSGWALLKIPYSSTMLNSETFQDIARGQAQCVSTLIGTLFCLFVFWSITDISIWKMRSFGKNTNAAILGFVAIALGIAMMLLFPNFFQIEVPDQFGWSMIIFLPTSSFYILRMLQSSKLMRHLPRYLTQP
ncbi:HAD-IC family P-type ATPase [Pseudanabaena sp. FACHB-1277]|uniref:HAD-IC family P-type ATPase n=1 Tax=Pseudanabaena cinerea FACHB-1277 TaxID=2949581 RepID=A0A926UR44_9CYAN|nr:HAD-IC family P-type ATPase [Pseudanabaena cinerea]MBD2149303.1 HAD-IC family P-type ATPase [Pseudanabaena cinerea FACHB-1277]